MTPHLWADAFLAALSTSGNVSDAARFASIHRDTAYNHRAQDEAFRAAWDSALEVATELLELEARRRALEGCERAVYYKGVECGRIREYSDALMMFLLRSHRPLKYRDNVKHEHEGEVTIKVEYADADSHLAPSPSWAGEDSEEL